MTLNTQNLRIQGLTPLVPPSVLKAELPVDDRIATTVQSARDAISRLLSGEDDRLLAIVGPCSIHDPAAALEYARRLEEASRALGSELLLVMRVYFEKPRTTVGWKGLINDPELDGSFAIDEGLRLARRLLCDIARSGLPTACEFLDPISPQYLADTVSWGAIGARTTESQVHRELASGLSMPVGFKNATNGSIRAAAEGVISARQPHRFLGVTEQGVAAIVSTSGNQDCHVILRGGEKGPNYDEPSVQQALGILEQLGLPRRLMVDFSHGNSGKDPRRQPEVGREVARQIAGGESGISGVMIESFLEEGRQEPGPRQTLRFGQSITDACLGWEDSLELLKSLAAAVKARRASLRTRG